MRVSRRLLHASMLLGLTALGTAAAGDRFVALQLTVPNPTGFATTVHATGSIDLGNAFFRSLGTNGRTCDSCHRAEDGWSVTPASVQKRFDQTGGTDPIFTTNDGSNAPHADVSTVERRREAYSMLLGKGLIRVGLPVPADAEFALDAVLDPYGHASAGELSLFRRPLPATNLRFLAGVMWDGRETVLDHTAAGCTVAAGACLAPLALDLGNQANGATTGHAQALQALTEAERAEIVAFEVGLFTAQAWDAQAGFLQSPDASGGPAVLGSQTFAVGANDFLLGNVNTGASFEPAVFGLFAGWLDAGWQRFEADERGMQARRSIARGEALFNGRTFMIDGVAGFNDRIGMAQVPGTCASCHNVPNAGTSSLFDILDIGVSAGKERTPDLPLYVLRNTATGDRVATSDPGRALVTGRWSDVNRFKVPGLRGLAARAPYFHNGSAADLDAVVTFYDRRFGIQLTPDESRDLVSFLRAL